MTLRVTDLAVEYRSRGRVSSRRAVNRAVDGVSFEIREGETFGLVGESGSGKSTTARAVIRLEPPSGGIVEFEGQDVARASQRALRSIRQRMQLVFQDPYSSLDPAMTIGQSLEEPLRLHRKLTRADRLDRVAEVLTSVGLSSDCIVRYPQQFSGGQLQRMCIARALMLDPSLVILDEPVSALDVSTQGQVLNLLSDIQGERGSAYLLIAHDLAVVRNLSHQMGVMYLGQIVETGPSLAVSTEPLHPYTQALMSAIPQANPRVERSRERIVLQGEIPSSWAPPSGCRFHTRCPQVMDVCRTVSPPLVPLGHGGHVSCHLYADLGSPATSSAPSVLR